MQLKLTTLTFLLIFALLTACSSDPLAPARELAKAGDASAAIVAYDSVLNDEENALSPEQYTEAIDARGELYIMLAHDAVKSGDIPSAITIYDTFLSEDEKLTPMHRSQAYYQRGMHYLDLGNAAGNEDALLTNYAAARSDLEAVLTKDSADSSSILLGLTTLASSYAAIEQWDSVISVADNILATRPTHADLLNIRGQAYLELGNFAQAIADLKASGLPITPAITTFTDNAATEERWEDIVTIIDAVLAVEPSNTELLNTRGQAQLELRNFEQAIADFKTSLQGAVDTASLDATLSTTGLHTAYSRLGNAMLDIGEYEDAINSFSAALENASDNSEKAAAYTHRGFTYNEMGETDKALTDFDQAIALNPERALTYAYRSFAYSLQENYDAAIADANKAVALGSDLSDQTQSTIYHSKASAHLQVGDYQAALSDATQSITLEGVDDPNAARTYGLRSRINYLLGDYTAAVADATKAIEVGASDITALDGFYYRRAYSYYRLEQYTSALDDINAALELGEPTAGRYEIKADILDALGDTDGAIANYQQALQIAPDDPRLHNYLGDIYYTVADYVGAETEYRAAIRLDDQADLFHSNLGYALREQERYDESVEAFSAALEHAPDDPWNWYARGRSRYIILDNAGAIADMEQAIALGPDDATLLERANAILDELR